MVWSSQNAFVSGLLKKICCALTPQQVSKRGWTVPMQHDNQQKSGHMPNPPQCGVGYALVSAGSDN
ncbi:MAG: hypothetical protein ACRDHZ_21545 [Ktedonobacteraceae bacterium]